MLLNCIMMVLKNFLDKIRTIIVFPNFFLCEKSVQIIKCVDSIGSGAGKGLNYVLGRLYYKSFFHSRNIIRTVLFSLITKRDYVKSVIIVCNMGKKSQGWTT